MQSIYFDTAEYDKLVINKISPERTSPEPELYQLKWWDYRLMHPAQATYFFTDAYVKAARDYYARNLDSETAAFRKPFSGKDIFIDQPTPLGKRGLPLKSKALLKRLNVTVKTLNALWKARQQADRMGIPYDLYCQFAMQYAEKHMWKHALLPSHLYITKAVQSDLQKEHDIVPVSVVEWIESKWNEYKTHRIVHSDLQFYRVSEPQTRIDQLYHRAFVIQQIKQRSEPLYSLVYALENELISAKEAKAVFGEKMAIRALRLAEE